MYAALDAWAATRTAAFAVFAVALIAAVFAVIVLGVRLGGDTPRYTSAAEQLLAGEPLPTQSLPYSGYVAVVAIMLALGAGMFGIVIAQAVTAALAAVALWRLGVRMAGGVAGIVAGLLFALNPLLVRWHSYVLTDSLYISMVAVLALLAVLAADRQGVWYGVAAAACLFAASLRPNGWLLILVVGSYWLARSQWPVVLRASLAVGLLVVLGAFAVASPIFSATAENVDASTALRDGVVIWGWRGTDVQMPQPRDDDMSGLAYMAQEPVASVRLMLTRIARELSYVRPYYSRAHNAVGALYFLAVYAAAAAGLWATGNRHETGLLLAIVLAQLALIAVTFADYDGRFVLYLLPAVSVLAGAGVSAVAGRLAHAGQGATRASA